MIRLMNGATPSPSAPAPGSGSSPALSEPRRTPTAFHAAFSRPPRTVPRVCFRVLMSCRADFEAVEAAFDVRSVYAAGAGDPASR